MSSEPRKSSQPWMPAFRRWSGQPRSQLVCSQNRSIQITAPVAASDRVDLRRIFRLVETEMNQVVARDAGHERELRPAQRLAQVRPEPASLAQAGAIAPIEEPEEQVDQAHAQEQSRPALPARGVPAAPEQHGSHQAAPDAEGEDPFVPGKLDEPVEEARVAKQADHQHDRPDACRNQGDCQEDKAGSAKLVGLSKLFAIEVEHAW